ncbi:MAG: DUF4198 domain-containing protein [Alphaproteobacteria bacterium]|jgi:hypothetical protein
MHISRILALILLLWGMLSNSARAHEFWLEPLRPMLAPGELFEANIKVGQKLEGDVYSYLPFRFRKFGFVDGNVIRPVRSTIGDRPAVAEAIFAPGMARLVYLSAPNFVTYETLAEFAKFAMKEGLDGAVSRHKVRKLKQTNFKEAYTRSAKALVRVGRGDGEDIPVGLPVELVAETNPFTASITEPVVIRLLWESQPAPGAQVSVFRRGADDHVTVARLRADRHGRVTVPGARGFHLVSAVRLVEPKSDFPRKPDVVWHSLWASLTFTR